MKILIKLLTLLAVLCAVACSQTFENESNNNLSSNSDTKAKGLLAMNVGEMSRTITNTLTNADIHSAVLTANNETVGNWSGEDVIGQIESDKSIILDVDYYDFVLSVKNEAGKTLATAQTSKYIEVGTNHISLSLKSVATGEGSFEVTFSWQSDYVNSIKAGLYDCETDEEITGCEMAALTVTDKTAVYAKDEIPTGQYMLMVCFYDNGGALLRTYTDILQVEAFRKTTATRQFAGFNTEHTIEYELTESWKSDFTPVIERNAFEEVELPTIENVDTENDVTSYTLKWYTTETFETGTEIKKIEAGTDKDMKLYGQIETCYRTTADGFLKTIQSLTVGGPHNVIVTGELTSSQLSTMATYIKNYSTRKINLDLSETTGLTYIDNHMFSGCTGLVNIIIPDSVTSIYGGAFYNCSSLVSIAIPDGVTSISGSAFYGCSSLTSITIPASVTSIGECWYNGYECYYDIENVFTGCGSLTAFNVSANNNYYCSSDDGKILYNKDKTTLLVYPSAKGDVTIPDSVTSIGEGAFENCSSLASVTIGNSVTSIGEWAFYGCSSLTSVTIPDSVTSIGEGAFYNCSSLASVTIPDSVTYIDNNAFEYCSSLTSVTIPDSVTSIGDRAFSDCSSLESVYIIDLTAWNNIEFYNSYSNPLYYGAKLYLNGSLVEFTVTFDAVGGSLSGEAVQTVKSGECAVEPTAPSKNGYVFCGWYTSTDAGQTLSSTAYNFDTIVKEDITLYAKWIDETVGYIAYSDGSISADYDNTKTPVGIVIEATDGTATKIVSLTQTSAKWSTEEVVTNATSETDGMANMTAIQSISGWVEKYPAFKWCDEYTDASDNSEWYLPAKDELEQLYSVKEAVNAAIEKITAGDDTVIKLGTDWYWSSSQCNYNHAWYQTFPDGNQYDSLKGNSPSVRAVRAF